MKKEIIFCMVLFFFNVYSYCYEPSEFNDSLWLPYVHYKYHVIDRNTVYNWYYDITTFSFPRTNNSKNKEDLGYFRVNGLGGTCVIYSVNKKTENEFEFVYGFIPDEANKDYINKDDVYTGTLVVINENEIVFSNSPYQGTTFTEPFHRLTNPNKKSKKAYVNDNNVRMRSEPTTNGIIYGKLQKDTQVLIIDQSSVSKADEKENVWYQIQIKNWPICWVFGEYITVEK